MDNLRELYQQVILDHNKNPRNFRFMEDFTVKADGHNPLCGDKLQLFIKIDGDYISDISFMGSGCAISKASASIMTEELKGKSIADAEKLFKNFRNMITSGEITSDDIGKLEVLTGVHKYPSRVKCALLAWHTLKNILDQNDTTTTTE
ncbi:MAG: SUF system NifU family Fe-S cluster assembly protein [Candidatus Marinimicrobia bacterium]|nr:SUF system NifU family Fe-S cluster assembly protein [Candidatus Neomarinimicrobiota bacterium]